MGRKPKNLSSSDTANDPGTAARHEAEATAPARRGRQPTLTAIPAKIVAASSSGKVAPDVIAAGSATADVDAPPVRRRPGPKPKPPVASAEKVSPRVELGVRRDRKARASSGSSADASPALDDGTTAASGGTPEASEGDIGARVPLFEPSMTDEQEATRSVAQDPAGPAQPAALWDRATDTVRFDLVAIEQTASREGPNQAMAKLIVAARAEGANSRWPL